MGLLIFLRIQSDNTLIDPTNQFNEAFMLNPSKTYIVAIAGASASGKTTIANAQADTYEDSYRWKQMTTRDARSTDEEYVFVDRATIEVLRDRGLLTCSTEFNDNIYGTFIETLSPKFVYVVVSPEGLTDLINSKHRIETALSKEVEILPVNVVYDITSDSIALRGRNRSLEFINNERKAIDAMDIEWFLTINSDELDVRNPTEFRKVLVDAVDSTLFDRESALAKVSALSSAELQELVALIDAKAPVEEVVESDAREQVAVSVADDDLVESVEEEAEPTESPALSEMRAKIEKDEALAQDAEKLAKWENENAESLASAKNTTFSLAQLKATFKDDFLDYANENVSNLSTLRQELILEQQLAGFLFSRNMAKDMVEDASTIKIEKREPLSHDPVSSNTLAYDITVCERHMTTLTFNFADNTIS